MNMINAAAIIGILTLLKAFIRPNTTAPIIVPNQESSKLQQQHNSRWIPPSQKQVFARQFLAAHDLSSHLCYDIELFSGSHSVLGLKLKLSIANIMFKF